MLIGLVYGFVVTPWYKVTVQIIPNISETPSIPNQYMNIAALAGINIQSTNEERMLLYPEIIKSNFVMDRILNHNFKTGNNTKTTLFNYFKISIDSSDISPGSVSYKEIEHFKKTLRTEIINTNYDTETGILKINIQFPGNAFIATEIANFIILQLDDYNKNYRKYKATEQIEFIENSIRNNEKTLKIAEHNFEVFQLQNKDISSPKSKIEFERLETEMEVQRNIYIELRKQLEIAKIEKIKETETLSILEEPSVPYNKFKPKRLIILIMSFFIGLIFSLLYISIESKWTDIIQFIRVRQ